MWKDQYKTKQLMDYEMLSITMISTTIREMSFVIKGDIFCYCKGLD
jgi:hypothetical protein